MAWPGTLLEEERGGSLYCSESGDEIARCDPPIEEYQLLKVDTGD